MESESFALRLRKSVDRLAEFPDSGRVLPEDPDSGIRELLVGNYRILYQVTGGNVAVLAVIHGARNPGRKTS